MWDVRGGVRFELIPICDLKCPYEDALLNEEIITNILVYNDSLSFSLLNEKSKYHKFSYFKSIKITSFHVIRGWYARV
ncbi:hypothetical protein [Bartonella sp. MR168JLCBS]